MKKAIIYIPNKSPMQSGLGKTNKWILEFKTKDPTKNPLISVKDNKNIGNLIKLIKDKLSSKFIKSNNILVTRERHRVKLNAALKEIEKFLKKNQKKEIETAAEDLRLATRHLGSIVGKVDVEEILGSIFQDFCIGK
jgi:tRNA modification GTPase